MKPDIFMDDFERTEYSDEVFGILGRVLTYACRFEGLCKSVAALKEIKQDPRAFESADDYEKLVRHIFGKTLNKTIESFSPEKTRFEVFEKARKARNEIVHGVAKGFDCCLDHLPSDAVEQRIAGMRSLISNIATADFLLSILTAIETHEPIPRFKEGEYADRVLAWVFGEDSGESRMTA